MVTHRSRSMDHSKPSYDECFADVGPGDETNDGMVKVFGSHHCIVCGRKTGWVHSKWNVYLCSRDCRENHDQQERT